MTVSPPVDFGALLLKKATEQLRLLMRHRDRYVKAWVASTAELVETVEQLDGAIRTTIVIQARCTCGAAGVQRARSFHHPSPVFVDDRDLPHLESCPKAYKWPTR